jgi:hypothetical protein
LGCGSGVYRNVAAAAAQSRADLGGRLGLLGIRNRTDCRRDSNSLGNDCGSLRYSRAVVNVNGTRCNRGHCSRVDSGRGHLDRSGRHGRAFRGARLVRWRGRHGRAFCRAGLVRRRALFRNLRHGSGLGRGRCRRLVTRRASCDNGRVLRDIRSADALQITGSRLGLVVIVRPSVNTLHDLRDEISVAAVAREVGVVLAIRLSDPGVNALREEVRGVGSFVSLRRDLDIAGGGSRVYWC